MDSNALPIDDYAYDVFLSFRGKDTRQGFTDVLYEFMTMADIRVFRDDDELEIGDKIDSILEAIDNSKICIPIFSPNFAESKWCLREVTRMVELKKTIVPVFYKVSPDDVKLEQKSVYADDFIKLQQNHADLIVEINNWKNSLREAASNKGRELGAKSYTQFCKEFLNEVIPKLGPRNRLDMEHHFVGDTNKAAVIEKLDMESSPQQVIYLGLHGMGGIGKTTLTKLIYNEFLPSFDYYAFLPNIREFSANGVYKLPSHLSENLKPTSVMPITQSEQIPNLFRNKKVLIILDDVDSDEQIKTIAREASWFGSGSRIILSSRDKKVFQDFEAESSRCVFRYLEMEELDHGWSLELFSRCAFGKDSPPLPYKDLSKKAIASAGGLPLAITVVAKQLRNQKEGVWKEIIERLKETPPKEVKARLLISYESLENEHKTIFLDIACLFTRGFNSGPFSEKSSIFYMWEACELYPRWSLEVLQSRSLVKIVVADSFDKFRFRFYFQIHDQLRDLARDIVIDKSGRDLTKQSRLWEKHEVLEVLKCKEKQKNMIEAIYLDDGRRCMVFRDEEFVSFDNLRYLELIWSKLRGDFSNLFPKLVYFACDLNTTEARHFAPPNLVSLNLSNGNVDENWDGWNQILVLKKLKVLNLSWCRKLQRTPVFPKNMPLEILNLCGCNELEYIDASIGKLQHLTQLNLHECRKLKKLPDSIGGLKKLEELDLSESGLQRTPVFLESMPLKILNLRDCRELEYIDTSIGKLPRLTQLHLGGCVRLKNLPDSIGELGKLEDLDLNWTRLQRTPVFLENMPLKKLNLSRCGELEYIDTSIGKLQHLTQLHLGVCELLKNLPDSIGGLENVEDLDLHFTRIQRTPVFLENMSLKILNLSLCKELEYIDTSIGKLQHLTQLNLSYCSSLEYIDTSIGRLQHLTQLDLSGCRKLKKLPDSIGGLEKLEDLDLSHSGLQRTPVFLEDMPLKKLNLCRCDELEYIDTSIGKLQHLTQLDLSGCGQLKNLPDSIGGLGKLEDLGLRSCSLLVELPQSLGNLHSLQKLDLSFLQNLSEVPDLFHLQDLNSLKLEGCQKLTKFPSLVNLKKLKYLVVIDCKSREILEVALQLKEHGVVVKGVRKLKQRR